MYICILKTFTARTIFLFFIIFNNTSYATKEDKKLEKISIQLLWKHQFEFAGFYVAKENGFYKNVGLDVELKEYDFNLNIVSDVEDGKSDYGVGYPSIILDKSHGKKIILLNALFQSSPHILVSLKSSGIKSIEDFKDKRIMISKDSIKTASILSMLYSHKIRLKDMKQVKQTFNIDLLIQKKVELISVYLSNEIYKLNKKGLKYDIWNPKDYGFDFYNDFLFTSQKELEDNPLRVEKFRKATLKGWNWAFNNIDKTVDLILSKYNTQNKSREALLYEARILKKLAYVGGVELGDIDNDKIQRIFDIYNLMGLVKNKLDLNEFIYKKREKRIIISDDEKKYLKEKKELKVCVNYDWTPYEFIENGKFKGISADFLKLISKELSLPIKVIKEGEQKNVKKFLRNRKCDIKPIFLRGRKTNLPIFATTSYLKDSLVLVTKIKEPFFDNLNIHKEKTFAISKGFRRLKLVITDKYPDIKLVEVETIDDGLKMVVEGKVFGYFNTSVVSAYHLQKDYYDNLKIVNKLANLKFGFAITNNNKTLYILFERILKNISNEEKNKIIHRWVAIKYEERFNYTLILRILIAVFLLVLLFLYKQYLLKKINIILKERVDEKTKKLAQSKKELEFLNQTLEQKVQDKTKELNNKNQELQQYLDVIDDIEIGLFIVDLDFKVRYMNKTMIKWFGNQQNKICYKSVAGIDEVCPYCKINDVIKFDKKVRYSPVTPNGQTFDIIAAPIHNLDGTISKMEVIRNVTEQNDLQEQLFQQSKMASMGEMIGNIAHQWRQPIAIISMWANNIMVDIDMEEINEKNLREYAKNINIQTQHLSQTIDDFRNFFAPNKEKTTFTLQNSIDKTMNLLTASFKTNNIKVIKNIENLTITSLENELTQALLNIIKNAKDILVTLPENRERLIFIKIYQKQDNIIIKIKDSGGGIKKDIIDKIFDPYFTTKHKSQGTGIGLYMTQSIIAKHLNGKIGVKNLTYFYEEKKQVGAEFTIKLKTP